MKESAQHARTHDLASIQCLRGVAAMMVVIYHCFPQLARMGYSGGDPMPLSAGVDIFFIISGFIMIYSTARSPGRGAGDFLLNRAIRILPLYWLLTAAMAAIVLFLPQLLQSSRFDSGHVLSSFLMIAHRHPVSGMWEPVLMPGWTLNYEIFFYLLFAGGLCLFPRSLRGLAISVSLALALIAAMRVWAPRDGVLDFYTNGLLVEFIYGIAAGMAFLRGWRLPRWSALLLIPAGIIGLALAGQGHGVPRQFIYGLPALAIFLGFLALPITRASRGIALPRLIGDASYALYLSHFMLMSALGQVWRKAGLATLPGRDMLFVATSALICTLAALILYRFVEMPMTDWLKRRLKRRGANTPAPLTAPDYAAPDNR